MGMFVMKYDKASMKFGNIKEFHDFTREIINNLDKSDKKIESLFIPCFKYERKNQPLPWVNGLCFGKEEEKILLIQEGIHSANVNMLP